MVSWQAFPSLPPRAPLTFLSHLKLPFPSLSNACHAGYSNDDSSDNSERESPLPAPKLQSLNTGDATGTIQAEVLTKLEDQMKSLQQELKSQQEKVQLSFHFHWTPQATLFRLVWLMPRIRDKNKYKLSKTKEQNEKFHKRKFRLKTAFAFTKGKIDGREKLWNSLGKIFSWEHSIAAGRHGISYACWIPLRQ